MELRHEISRKNVATRWLLNTANKEAARIWLYKNNPVNQTYTPMTRTIRFRGKAPSGIWCFGYYEVTKLGQHVIHFVDGYQSVVDVDTIGQFTCLHDRNGKDMYEGDLYRVANNQIYEIVWLEELEYEEKCSGWGLRQLKGSIPPFLIDTFAIKNGEVIGNIYEKPDFLAKPISY